MVAFIIITIFVISMIVAVIAITRSAEEFPDYYNPACFDCNKGGESCPSCKYLDPEYRDPEGMWKAQKCQTPEEIQQEWNKKIHQELIDKQ